MDEFSSYGAGVWNRLNAQGLEENRGVHGLFWQ